MKVKESFFYVIAYVAISLLLFFIPMRAEPLLFYIFWIGIFIYICSGISLLIASISNSKKIVYYGLIAGFGSWSLLIISGIFYFILNYDTVQFWHLINTLESAKLINPVIDIDLPSYIISEILYGENVNNIIYSLGIIIITVIGAIVAIFTFQKFLSELEMEADYSKLN